MGFVRPHPDGITWEFQTAVGIYGRCGIEDDEPKAQAACDDAARVYFGAQNEVEP